MHPSQIESTNPEQAGTDRLHTVDALFLAPHLDDVALSCGGGVYQRTQAGETVLIVTVMAGDANPTDAAGATATPVTDFAQSLHARWNLDENPIVGRRQEDLDACTILGATPRHLNVPDCIYRGDAQGFYYQSRDEIFGAIHPREADQIHRLAQAFHGLPQARHIFAPLCVGHHVDHQLVRAAAETVWDAHQLAYYEDYPYAERAGALERALGLPRRGPRYAWAARSDPLTQTELDAKGRAIQAFRSQISTFFVNEQEMRHRLVTFAGQRGGERVWFQRI